MRLEGSIPRTRGREIARASFCFLPVRVIRPTAPAGAHALLRPSFAGIVGHLGLRPLNLKGSPSIVRRATAVPSAAAATCQDVALQEGVMDCSVVLCCS